MFRFCVSSENKNLISENGVIYTLGKKKLIKYPAGKVCDIFFVPDEVEEIGEYAFAHAKHVSGVYIGKNCRSIKKNAFHKAGSPIEKYCRETGRNGITFEVVEDDKLEEWLTPPPEPEYVEFQF